jgi:hypothetical protein
MWNWSACGLPIQKIKKKKKLGIPPNSVILLLFADFGFWNGGVDVLSGLIEKVRCKICKIQSRI